MVLSVGKATLKLVSQVTKKSVVNIISFIFSCTWLEIGSHSIRIHGFQSRDWSNIYRNGAKASQFSLCVKLHIIKSPL